MKAILISTRPQWVIKIIAGIKKSEIRKGTALYKAINTLIREQGTAPVLLYCTKDRKQCLVKNNINKTYHLDTCYWDEFESNLNGKVVAQFNATVEEIKIHFLNKQLTYRVANRIEYTTKSLSNSQLKKSSCLSNDEMNNYFKYVYEKNVVGTAVHINDLKVFGKPKEINEFKQCFIGHKNCIPHNCSECPANTPLTRAPQSWCYVEV